MMSTLAAMVVGVLVGALAALPLVVVLHAVRPSVMRGLAAALASFTLLTVAIALVRVAQSEFLLPFSVPAVLVFLALVVMVALRRSH